MAACELGLVRRERLADLDAAVEIDHLRDVVRLQTLDEVGGGGLQRRQLVFHAGAAVEQQRQRDRLLPAGEERELLLDAVLEDREVVLLEIGDVVVRCVNVVTLSETTSTPARKVPCAEGLVDTAATSAAAKKTIRFTRMFPSRAPAHPAS